MKTNRPVKKLGEAEALKIYLIGACHEVQWNNNLPLTKDFKNYLVKKIKDLNVGLVAEEFSKKALERNGIGKTTIQEVTDNLDVKHKLCDPDSNVRKELGIPSREEIKRKLDIQGVVYVNSEQDKKIGEEQRKYHSIRERFWFNQIKGETPTTILFVCGTDHLESFKNLLENNNYEVEILSERFDIA